ncbi:chemotaxis protein CheW [Anaeromyxobacter dehalogenans]|uniref:CheW protein n=1 Tax=Anaeromyxobacter dehalogenans (strain 2CP-C) TaxID=290397 RepID=Q2IQ84_ANADE|nr:chemotaxis protein CheW [Anaeromyxobacter dehalogenans]ABC80969.1 CheW protein [Anaeromyxobacter dehalogenans 2CP-C]
MTAGERRRAGAPIDWKDLEERLARAAAALGSGARPSGEAARAALQARARALAAPPPAPRPAGARPVLAFRLGGERYALETGVVREVARPPRLARLPGAPAFVAGLANLRGELVDVLDVREYLGAPPAPAGERTRLLVLGGERAELALLADEVDGLDELVPGDLLPAPAAPRRARPEYVLGVTAAGLALLDGAALLRDPRLAVDAPSLPTEVT